MFPLLLKEARDMWLRKTFHHMKMCPCPPTAFMLVCVNAFISIRLHACMCVCLRTFLITYPLACILSYFLTCFYASLHIRAHEACVRAYQCTCEPTFFLFSPIFTRPVDSLLYSWPSGSHSIVEVQSVSRLPCSRNGSTHAVFLMFLLSSSCLRALCLMVIILRGMPIRGPCCFCFRRVDITQRSATRVVLALCYVWKLDPHKGFGHSPLRENKTFVLRYFIMIASLRHCVPLTNPDASNSESVLTHNIRRGSCTIQLGEGYFMGWRRHLHNISLNIVKLGKCDKHAHTWRSHFLSSFGLQGGRGALLPYLLALQLSCSSAFVGGSFLAPL